MGKPYKDELKRMLKDAEEQEHQARRDALQWYLLALKFARAAMETDETHHHHNGRCYNCDVCRTARAVLREGKAPAELMADLLKSKKR